MKRPDRIASHVVYGVFAVALLLGVWAFAHMIAAESGSGEPGDATFSSAFMLGVLCNTIAWAVGWTIAYHITETADAQLFALTPLTPSLYFTRNLKRIATAVAIVVLGTPIAFVFLQTTFYGALGLDAPSAAAYALTFLLFLIVPLSEALSGRRWTGAIFFVRVIVRYTVVALEMLLGLAWRWIGPLALAPFALVGFGIWYYFDALLLVFEPGGRALIDAGAVGWLAYYFLLPLNGLFLICGDNAPAPLKWTLVALLAAISTRCLWSIRKFWVMPTEEIEQRFFEHWSEHRDDIEEHEEQAYREQEKRRERFSNIDLDWPETPTAPDNDEATRPGRTMAYDPDRSPEAQLTRHANFWNPTSIFLIPWTHAYLIFVCVLWLVWLRYGPQPGRQAIDSEVSTQLSPILWIGIFASSLVRANEAAAMVRRNPFLGVRAWSLFGRLWHGSASYLLVADGLAAVLATMTLQMHPVDSFLFFASISALRLALFLGAWMELAHEAGRRVLKRLYYLFVVLAMLWTIFSVIALTMEYDEQNIHELGYFIPTGVIVLFIATVLLALLLGWRASTQMVAPPAIEPFSLPSEDNDA